MSNDEKLRERLEPYRGGDPILDYMMEKKIPLTREDYLYSNGLTEPLGAEHEAMLPPPFQLPV